jgi:hypothetical protein
MLGVDLFYAATKGARGEEEAGGPPDGAINILTDPLDLGASSWQAFDNMFVTTSAEIDPEGGTDAFKLDPLVVTAWLAQGINAWDGITIPVTSDNWNIGVWHKKTSDGIAHDIACHILTANGFTVIATLEFTLGDDWQFSSLEFAVTAQNVGWVFGTRDGFNPPKEGLFYTPHLWKTL